MHIVIIEGEEAEEILTGPEVLGHTLQELAQKAVPCYESIARQAMVIERIPTDPGIWREWLEFYEMFRPYESRDRASGDIFTIIEGNQKLAILLPHPLWEESYNQRMVVVEYRENEGQPNEYGFDIAYGQGGHITHHRLAIGYPLMSRAATKQPVHEEVVRRAIDMMDRHTTDEGRLEAARQLEVYIAEYNQQHQTA